MPALLEAPEVSDRIHRFTVEDYLRFAEVGIVDESVELIDGIILEKMPKSPLHIYLQGLIADLLKSFLGKGSEFHVRSEAPLVCSELSLPEPDISVVPGQLKDYRFDHPTTAKLIVEVAVSSESHDRQKSKFYAEAGVTEYWIVLPRNSTVVVFRDLQPEGAVYATETIIKSGNVASTALKGFSINLEDLFPIEN